MWSRLSAIRCMSLCMDKMVRYERKVHSCVRCGNIYTCISPAVCTFARETPDCPKCYQGPPYKQQEERAHPYDAIAA